MCVTSFICLKVLSYTKTYKKRYQFHVTSVNNWIIRSVSMQFSNDLSKSAHMFPHIPRVDVTMFQIPGDQPLQ